MLKLPQRLGDLGAGALRLEPFLKTPGWSPCAGRTSRRTRFDFRSEIAAATPAHPAFVMNPAMMSSTSGSTCFSPIHVRELASCW